MKDLEKWVEMKLKEERQIELLVDLMTEFYGVDPLYYDVDAYSLSRFLIEKGVVVPVR